MKTFFPFLNWVKTYKKEYLSGDISAGLTVGVMLIPQGMAYAMLAGLPPIYGLYASTIPLIIYALFGTSPQLAVGPVAMVALLISSGVGALAELGSAEYISLAILLALMVGVIQFAMGAFRLGFLVNFLSHPVIAGFTSAAALIIGFSQMKHLLGISIPRGAVHETIIHIVEKISEVNLSTLAIGISAITVLLIVKKVNKKIPGPLIAVLLGIIAVISFGLTEHGVNIVRDIPGGFPSFEAPVFNLSNISALLPIAFTISFVGFMESIAVAKAIRKKYKYYEIVPNQELIGLGLANIVGSFFKAFPVTGGFSRTAVNDQAGAKSGLASIISAILVIITLLFLTTYFYYLPHAVLAAIILVAVFGLIDFKEALHLWHTDKTDFILFLLTATGTLLLGIEEGILIGVILSLIMVIYRVSYPHLAELGKIPGQEEYRNVDRFDHLETSPEISIIRIDAPIYFANLNFIKDYIYKKLQAKPSARHLILDARAIHHIDSSGVHMLHDLIEDLEEKGMILHFVQVTGPVRDILEKNNLFISKRKYQFWLNTTDAIEAIKGAQQNTDSEPYLFQTS